MCQTRSPNHPHRIRGLEPPLVMTLSVLYVGFTDALSEMHDMYSDGEDDANFLAVRASHPSPGNHIFSPMYTAQVRSPVEICFVSWWMNPKLLALLRQDTQEVLSVLLGASTRFVSE